MRKVSETGEDSITGSSAPDYRVNDVGTSLYRVNDVEARSDFKKASRCKEGSIHGLDGADGRLTDCSTTRSGAIGSTEDWTGRTGRRTKTTGRTKRT